MCCINKLAQYVYVYTHTHLNTYVHSYLYIQCAIYIYIHTICIKSWIIRLVLDSHNHNQACFLGIFTHILVSNSRLKLERTTQVSKHVFKCWIISCVVLKTQQSRLKAQQRPKPPIWKCLKGAVSQTWCFSAGFIVQAVAKYQKLK